MPRDAAQAVAWYRKAAEQGDAVAQNNLGVSYAKGEGVPRDAAQAVAWFRKAAEQGNAVAQKNLGVSYAKGEGVARDVAQAVYWQALAASQGEQTAIDNLAKNLPKLREQRIAKPIVNIRKQPTTDAEIVTKASAGTSVYILKSQDGWHRVYLADGHVVGWIAASLLQDAGPAKPVARAASSPYPAAPAPRPGYITCRTNCMNGDCYRTYSDGRQVHFQAKRTYNSLSGEWEWDSGGC